MVCQKCGKQLTFCNDSRFVEKIDGVNVTVCENCHNQIHNLFYTKETQKPDNNDTQSLANKITEIKDRVKQEKKAKGSAAFTIRIIANVILVAFTIGGGILGYVLGVEYDTDIGFVVGPSIGSIVGLIVSFLSSLLMRYFAELGENTKKIANASIKQASIQYNDHSKTQQLIEYKQLLDQGVITQEEFDSKKKQLLGL